MSIRTKRKNVQRISWIILTDAMYRLASIADEYEIPNSVYIVECIGPTEWNTNGDGSGAAVRISATRRELLDILTDFKCSCPDADIMVMKS